ncbi:MAG: hypothetical protein MJ198_03115 [Bacteroidales bacterium]|nr:hypothetical protein [Bacteroidales bacterium]
MKRIVITAFTAMMAFSHLSAQDFSDLKGKLLSDSVEYAEYQPKVIECSDFLLNSTLKTDENNLIAFDFLVEWMNNNPYYNFQTHKKFFKVISTNAPLTARYFAALCKTAIENNFSISEEELQYQAIDKFVRYCMYKKYHVEIDKKLEKYVEAKKDGKLQEIL